MTPLQHCSAVTLQTGGCFPTGQPTVQYNELSGFLSIVAPPLITLAGVAVLWWWHNRCHVHRCWWPAPRTTAAGERACWRHHPHKRRTAADIHAAHHAALATARAAPDPGRAEGEC